MIRRLAPVTAALLLGAPDPATALVGSDYLPLEDGWTWTYGDDRGNDGVGRVTGTRTVRGVETIVVEWEFEGTSGVHFEAYFTRTEESGILLHGVTNFSLERAFAYVPPAPFLPGSFEVGLELEQAIEVCDLDDLEEPCTVGIFRFGAVESVPIDTPLGTFPAIGFYQLVGSPGGRMAGALPTPAARGTPAFEWRTAGIGLVRDLSWTLTGYTPPTPVEPTSWGRLKALYGLR